MKKLLFLDVEATGVSEEDRLLQLAYRFDGGEFINDYFNPGTPIKVGAMAIHHVTEKDIAEKPQFRGSRTESHLRDVRDQGATFVAHNAKYDLGMMKKEGLEFENHICTLKVARAIDKEGKFEAHTLQYLRYYYDLDIQLNGLSPHDALADIIVLEEVCYQLASELCKIEGIAYDVAFDRMIEISSKPNLIHICSFKKHAGRTWQWVAENEMGYIKYFDDKDVDEDTRYTMDYWKAKMGVK